MHENSIEPTYLPTYLHTYIHTYIHTDRQTDRHEIFRKDVPYDNIKRHKKPGFHSLSLEDTFFEKPERVLGLNLIYF